jgi:hypothetical protein
LIKQTAGFSENPTLRQNVIAGRGQREIGHTDPVLVHHRHVVGQGPRRKRHAPIDGLQPGLLQGLAVADRHIVGMGVYSAAAAD